MPPSALASHRMPASPSTPSLTSPNPIPPRRSSTGLARNSTFRPASPATASPNITDNTTNNTTNNTTATALTKTTTSASGAAANRSFTTPTTTTLSSLLGPVAEADGRQQNHHHHRQRNRHATNPVSRIIMQHQHLHQPPLDPQRYAHEDLNFAPERSWTESKEKVIRAPFDYVAGHAGKQFRSQLINAFNALLQVPPDRLDIITRAVGMLHESSLLVDDVQDSSELRRGFPVAHNIFGVPQTINSANYIYFVALQELQKLDNPKVIPVFADELVNLHRGQGMDLFWRDTLTCPTEDDYLEMVGNKTGGLFRLGIKLMQAESAATFDCVPLVNLIGLIFQIRDDYMNLSSQEYTDNKGLCEDLTEGKFSFPVIHSIRADPTNMQLINILKQKTTDVQVKRYAVSYMESTGSFDYTKSVIAILIERARKLAREMENAGNGNLDMMQKILDRMVVST